ncbi:MAG: ABC transporter permease [Alphaproteobacteria bacterium]|nr:ABC transporter permease [Alphaproteobacteria bacterium]
MDMIIAVSLTIMTAATPLLFAALGEAVVERSGVLNLGVEGMMVMGAVCGFGAALYTGSPWLGLLAAILAGIMMSLLFGFLTLTLVSNQVATGLALTLLGIGLSGQIGESFVGQPGVKVPNIGGFDPLILVAVALTAAVSWFLFKTKSGLVIRAVGNSHSSAHALGYNVIGVRYLCVMFGGALAGLAGGYLSLVYTPQWVENMTAGRGWIALALVVFASWRPWRTLAGAYLFGAISILSFTVQTFAWGIPSQFLSSLPYLVTIVALVIISGNRMMMRANTPACLGQPFVPDR